ncbi:hypothetical protein [Catellatospora sichuanensis]|uniref:hypothetical protein n=1 Tax=Catellatospora sichuanensis TaxID=1969805 RepID=UPI001183AC7D|nr:hypothetical protein [Catellatospora sichuanensis]
MSVVFLALVVSLMVLASNKVLAELGPSWRAANGEGVAGTFNPTGTYEVGRRTQIWKGDFVSDDRSVLHFDVQLDNAPPDMRLGRPVPALDTGAQGVVYVPGADYPFVTNLLCLGCLSCPLVLLGLIVVPPLLRRMRRPRTGDRPAPA